MPRGQGVRGYCFSPWFGVLTLSIAAGFVSPAAAQESQCAHLDGAEEVACLREALARTQEALTRAVSSLQEDEPPQEALTVVPTEPELGAEQAARRMGTPAPRAAEEERIVATVALAERVHPNRLQVHLDNGQIWRQIQGDVQRVDLSSRGAVSAEIWRSGFGGYRMRLPEVRRVLKVERIR